MTWIIELVQIKRDQEKPEMLVATNDSSRSLSTDEVSSC